MNIIDTILKACNIDDNLMHHGFRYVAFGEDCLYLEGIVGLKSYDKNTIVFFIKKGEIEIEGENLYLKKMQEGDSVIKGKIVSVRVKR